MITYVVLTRVDDGNRLRSRSRRRFTAIEVRANLVLQLSTDQSNASLTMAALSQLFRNQAHRSSQSFHCVSAAVCDETTLIERDCHRMSNTVGCSDKRHSWSDATLAAAAVEGWSLHGNETQAWYAQCGREGEQQPQRRLHVLWAWEGSEASANPAALFPFVHCHGVSLSRSLRHPIPPTNPTNEHTHVERERETVEKTKGGTSRNGVDMSMQR